MAIHKGESGNRTKAWPGTGPGIVLRAVIFSLPFACILAFALGLPMPVPRFLVPTMTYMTEGSLPESAYRAAAAAPFSSTRIVLRGEPSLADVLSAREHWERTGRPVIFDTAGVPAQSGPVAAYSLSLSQGGEAAVVTILLDEAAAAGPVRVSVDGMEALRLEAAPADRRVSVPVEPAEGSAGTPPRAGTLVEVVTGPPGSSRKTGFTVEPAGIDRPRTLLASDRAGGRSVIEALLPVRRIGYAELGTASLYDYELVVLDGPVLPELGSSTAAALAGYVERGSGSLLVVIDSSDAGRPGDAPELERLLPVDLSPRSVSRLPDVAMVVALDVSGSMFGDKLSLAKAVGLELVANLKPSDVAAILPFDEESRWLYPPAPVADLDARRSLAPLRAGGGTRMYPALAMCIAALESSGQPEKRIVVVSDGISAPADFDSLAARAFASGISISAMAVGSEYDKALLTRISAGSGGRFYRVRDASEVPSLIIEDRKSISRAVFAEGRVDVVDIAGAPAGRVDGMARLGPKPDSVAWFSSRAGDPLLASRREGARSVLVYASDIHGRWGADFLARPATLTVLRSLLDGLFSERQAQATLTETADGPSVSMRGDWLVEPRASIADASGRILRDAPFDRTAPGWYHAAFGALPEGRYTALIEDRGRTVARFAIHTRPGLSGVPSDSAAAAAAYRTPFWAMPRGRAAWLVAFFALSLWSTLLSRMKR